MFEDVRAEKGAGNAPVRPFDGQILIERLLVGIVLIPPPFSIAPYVNAAEMRERFKKRRPPGPVLAHEERDRSREVDGLGMMKDREVEGIPVPERIFVRMKSNAFEMQGWTSK